MRAEKGEKVKRCAVFIVSVLALTLPVTLESLQSSGKLKDDPTAEFSFQADLGWG
ncbi:hypothetical protein [Streptomyces sp. NPDC056632]|uniref:hypothetical protein n=1 Tax=Streptomyces sp. NPDC056632 TaxID=3345884 RepID=UPI0036810253